MSTRVRDIARNAASASTARRFPSSSHAASRRGALAGDAWRLLVKASAVLDRSMMGQPAKYAGYHIVGMKHPDAPDISVVKET